MSTSLVVWFAVTIVSFLLFVGWVFLEIRSINHRQLVEGSTFDIESSAPEDQ